MRAEEVPTAAARSAAERVRVLGLPVDRLTLADAVEIAAQAIRTRRPLRIVVTNANKAWLACRDGELRALMERAELVVPEYAMVWAMRRLGRGAGAESVAGIRLTQRLLTEAPARGWSVFFLGARPDVVEALVARVKRDHPGLRIAGHHHGYLDAAGWSAVRAQLARSAPDILFMGMGSPLQERRMMELPEGPLVRIGVGGSLDVLAGVKRDAPAWMRNRGLEWLFRLSQDPRNLWRRYAVTNPWIVWSVLRERLTGRVPARDG